MKKLKAMFQRFKNILWSSPYGPQRKHHTTFGLRKTLALGSCAKFLSTIMLTLPCYYLVKGQPSSQTAINPILPGFNPDPSVLRVGNDYGFLGYVFHIQKIW
jgi:hypothetical protein